MEYDRDVLREEFKGLFHYSLDLIYVYGTSFENLSQFIDANDLALEALGYTREELRHLAFKDLIDKRQIKQAFTNLREILKTGKNSRRTEYKLRRKDGNYIFIETYGIPLKKEGKIYAVLGIANDITERKKAEQLLKESEEKYRRAFNLAEFYKDLFAHDISNILQTILSTIEFCMISLEEKEEMKEITELFNNVKRQITRGANLVSNVRALSKIESMDRNLEDIGLLPILNKAIEFVTQNNEDRINIEFEPVDERIQVKANDLLIDVFDNVLFNAARHNDNSIVEIKIMISKIIENTPFIKMEFIDNGKGVKDENKELIFERSYDGHKNDGGMGIGLSLVKKILNSYDGRIWVEDKVEGDHTQGSNFVVIIPQ